MYIIPKYVYICISPYKNINSEIFLLLIMEYLSSSSNIYEDAFWPKYWEYKDRKEGISVIQKNTLVGQWHTLLGFEALHSAGPWPQLSVPWHQIWKNVSSALSLVSSASWMHCQHLAVVIHCFPFETLSKFYWYVLSLYSSRLCVVEMAVSSCLSLVQGLI